jgi:ElaB/YqjD/DUF883 family membrane-anchored ribosome-binding protein
MSIDFVKLGKDYKGQKKTATAAREAAEIHKGSPLTLDEAANLSNGFTSDSKSFNLSNPDNTFGGTVKSIGQGILNANPAKEGSFSDNEFFGIDDAIKLLTNLKGGWEGFWKDTQVLANQVLEQYRQEAYIRNTINKEIGVTGALSDSVRDTILNSTAQAMKFGYSVKDITESYTQLNAISGRFNFVSGGVLRASFATARAFLDGMGDMGKVYGEFEKVGIGFKSTLDAINKIGKDSLTLGLSSKATIKDVRDNLDKLNQYGFKNGIDGLAQMSRIAKIFRMDMAETFKVADKVMNPEGAIEMSSRLQALGGAFGEFNDVFKLMYDSTNNVEDLQKSIVGMTKDLATYNEQEGRFGVTGANIRRAKEMADITGISYAELTKGAIAAQEKIKGLQELTSSGFVGKKEDRDFLMSLAHMENGKMVISVPDNLREQFGKVAEGGIIMMSDMTEAVNKKLISYKDEIQKMNPEDIARAQFTEIQNMQRDVASIASYLRARAQEYIQGGAIKGLGVGGAINLLAGQLDKTSSELALAGRSGMVIKGEAEQYIKKAANSAMGGFIKDAEKWYQKANESFIKAKEQNAEKDLDIIDRKVGRVKRPKAYDSPYSPAESDYGNDQATTEVVHRNIYEFKVTGNALHDTVINQATKAGMVPDVKKGSFTAPIKR